MRKAQQLPKVSVVIPTLNEAKNLPHVLPELPEIVGEVILVDGGSRDNTITAAKELRPDIRILRQTGRGKGNALAEGFESARSSITSVVAPRRAMALALRLSSFCSRASLRAACSI